MKFSFKLLVILLFLPLLSSAQKIKDVTGSYSYFLTDNDNITLREAKHKCVELAKAQAIKDEFGEFITSDIVNTSYDLNGEDEKTFFWENTVASAKGDWLQDIEPARITMEVVDNHLVITANVKGKARELIQSNIDLKWAVQRDMNGSKIETDNFIQKERIYVNFKAPGDGYVAVYLLQGTDETFCLLPYPKDNTGLFPVERGKEYVFFDKSVDPRAQNYVMTASEPEEFNQVVIMYSPKPFSKCLEKSNNPKRPNSLSTSDFQSWVTQCRRKDPQMVVDKKWIKIRQNN